MFSDFVILCYNMPSCIFKHCKSCSQKQKKDDGISFHRFPTELDLRDQWVTIVRQYRQDNDWLPSKFCVVCSLHFKENDVYFTEKGRRLVKKTSKPTQNLDAVAEKSSVAEGLECRTALENQAGPSNLLEVDLPVKSIRDDSVVSEIKDDSVVSEIRDSHLDFDTPTKKQLRKYKLLYVTTKRKLKTLRQKNQRLEKRNASMKNILKDIKDKNIINIHNLLRENIILTELFQNLYKRRSSNKTTEYSPAIRKFCLSLNFYSPKAYEYVRKTLNTCLPHPKTLAKW